MLLYGIMPQFWSQCFSLETSLKIDLNIEAIFYGEALNIAGMTVSSPLSRYGNSLQCIVISFSLVIPFVQCGFQVTSRVTLRLHLLST